MSNVDVDSLLPEIEAPQELPEPELNTEAPPDKEPQARDDKGQFAGDKPKEEPKVEVKPEPKQEKESRTIPLAAHLEERRALKAELDTLRREMEALKNPPKPPAPEPAFQDDPKAYVDHTVSSRVQAALDQLNGVKQTAEAAQQAAQQSTQQVQEQSFFRDLGTYESEFAKQNPDYFEAVAHIRAIRVAQLQEFDPDITQEQVREVITREERGMAIQLAQKGRNPVDVAYKLAKAYGFQPKKPAEAMQLPQVPGGPKQLPPDQTLGTGAATAADESDASQSDPFTEAFSEMFGKRKAS